MNVMAKLIMTSGAILAFMVLLSGVAVANLATANSLGATMYADRLQPIQQLGEVSTQFMNLRRLVAYGVAVIDDATAQGKVDADIATAKAAIDKNVGAYAATYLLDSEKTGLAKWTEDYAAYLAGVDNIRALTLAGDGAGATAKISDVAAAGLAASGDLANLRQINVDEAGRLQSQISASFSSGLLVTIGLTAAAFVLGLGIAVFNARRIAGGLRDVQVTLTSLTDRCATWLEEGLGKLADNDLTYHVTPVTEPIARYGTDEIDKTAEVTNKMRDKLVATIDAYNRARDGLTATVTEVRQAAEAVSTTSGQLNEASTQSGAATQQVAQTIAQVAAGTAEQARSSGDTNAAVEELSAVIASVSSGAEATSAAVNRSMDAVTSMQSALSTSEQAAEDLKPANERAATALDKVAEAIKENAAGMARIKAAVDESAVKVAELGAKGDQIGAIVETIDDIAEQTNLLALNAAIEAARAGEMGKGFAVVADEVRKLAERSGRATKEIAALIAEVQKGTHTAVAAMEAGAAEVDKGLTLGLRQTASLAEVDEASVVRNAALDRVFQALAAIDSAAAQVTAASDEIARVVEQTATDTQAMASASGSVTQAIGSIAAVSQENSAAAEEVSAATEEMSAQAEEVVASAATLADMAAQLDALVARFALEGASSARGEYEAFRKAHRSWVTRIERMIGGTEHIDAATLGDHRTCALGKWFYGTGGRQHASQPGFGDIERPHAEMHAAVKRAVAAHDSGNKAAAQSALSEVRHSSEAVVRALDGLEQGSGASNVAEGRRASAWSHAA
ncbi:MAG: methyl-accepting chemotaxis protein [Chloroflexota bacterium]